MSFEIPDISPAIPEMFLLGMACLVLVIDLFLTSRNRVITYLLSQLTLIAALVLTLYTGNNQPVLTFSDTFVRDPMGDVLKIAVYIATFVTFLYAKDYLRVRDIFKGEFYVLGLFGVLGMMILISAHNFLTVYLGLELLALSLYALVAMQRDSRVASEAAMKYFVLGAIASGMLLYGMSMIYWTWPKSRHELQTRHQVYNFRLGSFSLLSASPSSLAPCRFICGCRMSIMVRRLRSRFTLVVRQSLRHLPC